MRRTLILLMALSLLPVPAALAQRRLPRNNPVEREVIESSRQIQREQRSLGQEQQVQFEINQLRQSLGREQLFPPTTGGFGRVCPPSRVGC